MTILSTLAGIGMAVGPPLIYADQAYSIVKKKDSSGFSHDVCGVLLIANTIRVFFWLGNRFETPLLIQSLLLILSQLVLLAICLHYKPSSPNLEDSSNYAPLSPLPNSPNPGHSREESDYLSQPPTSSSRGAGAGAGAGVGEGSGIKGLFVGGRRPFGFWQWDGYGNYLEFLAGLILLLGVLQIILGRWMWYIDALGFIALTIESTLPIPQFVSNFQRKSCYGFRSSTLAGWFFGDAYKTVYFFLRGSPIQFKVTAIMTLCWDSAVLAQRIIYGANPPREGSSQYASATNQSEESRGLRADDERQFSIS
ncbi:uncharacterized protein I303_106628 [Kwoniella dejecticola CBS 10117]|uniref:PQ loop repeat protein n=1 Tax=Kwoniella dejecticola CBS 10117 TaxID=1296121 RepID=A0A1A5ZU55_9TREE|nr:uncharacterized protein I303_08112 [Kwoniella dejecticola CBS 10117]OBR81342.1 hypothetical protein I303_08112 [Kwoniella dejecticola CBS 10117]